MTHEENQGTIVPGHAYTLEQAAKLMGVTSRWLRMNLIDTGELPTARRGKKLELIAGYAIIQWIERNMVCHDGETESASRSSSERES